MVSRRKSRSEDSVTAVSSAPAKASSSPWVSMMKDIRKTTEASKMDLVSPDMFADMYGVKYFIDTGLPSLNLYLGQDGENLDSHDPVYGLPTGRIGEIVGSEGSYKTFLIHKIGAEVIARGGVFFYISSELDFDLSFFRHFYDKRKIAWDDVMERVMVGSARTPVELQNVFKVLIPKIDKFRENERESSSRTGPILIAIDSLGAMAGGKNSERFISEKDEGDQTGSHAKEIHDTMKYILRPIAKNDVAVLVANHYRDNLGFGFTKFNPAHNSTMKYYCTYRIDMNLGKVLKESIKQAVKYIESQEVRVGVRKVRGALVGDGKFSLVVNQNMDFDYWSSLVEALIITDIMRKNAKGYFLNISPESEDLLEMECAQRFEENSWTDLVSASIYLRKDPEGAALLERLAYVRGPVIFNKDKE